MNIVRAMDGQAAELAATLVTPQRTRVMQGFTFLGTHKFLIPANLLLTAYFYFLRKNKTNALKIALTALGATALMALTKHLFVRARPLHPVLHPVRGYSFPSGHAIMSICFFGLLGHLTLRHIPSQALEWTTAAAIGVLILLIDFSRVYLGLHYASDVVAGFCIGLGWLSLCLQLVPSK